MKKVVAALLAPLALASTYDEWDLPDYCMATDTMDKVAIPPLTSNRPMELVQAQVIARHGARAPYSRVFCWETAPSPALVDGLFPYDVTDDSDTEHMLTWMTADGATDYIDHKSDNSCPALPFVRANSPFNGTFSWDTCLECLMIARCNDLALPPGMTQELFDGLIHHVQARKKLVLTFQSGRYAKVDMHHMWADVLQRIDKIIADPQHAPRLSITIGNKHSLKQLAL
ncbi:hypothetical protein DYB28_004996 [Aphanomyces astaci]|uniref:Histidine acid phosphatase n=1 Tax=Aphanomyces astaci TaxID=112090 RepID=A0A397AE62_APHAT|nr:hypothetical protein DYB36_008851 [Aphanomyces astaci]RHY59502.1 hypothetical protein DYB34_001161 [Aphanomyces astaci]RHY73699.1 hypothetical protein DYB30_006210 [Aphanomyces astaci]RHZ31191.1 hypothetical protein DYB26_006890 [Aphanomyces astaci]RLO05294.1 hypothetical protein DYB28_004996 [Aphanomyces astaci]